MAKASQTNFIDPTEPERKKAEDSIRKLERDIRDKTYEVKEKLKKSKAYLRLLKDAAITVDDIYFRCHQPELGMNHLVLVANQSNELGTVFAETTKLIAEIEESKKESQALKEKYGIEEGQLDYNDFDDDEEDGIAGSPAEYDENGEQI